MKTSPRDAAPAMITRRAGLVSLVTALGLGVAGCAAASSDDATATSGSAGSDASADLTAAAATASTGSSATTTAGTITATATAATAFLGTLSEDQVDSVTYDYDDETKTTSWSNFPVSFVERAGLNLSDLTSDQQAAGLAVLAALLSDEGYATATGIMGGDQFLLEHSSSTEDSLGQYYLAFFGEPSATGAWTLQFGGHHLGLNATMDGTNGTLTFAPTHLGSQPAVYTDADGQEVQPLAGMYEDGFAFFGALSAAQRATLYQGTEVSNLQSAPGDVSDYPTGTGIAGSDLSRRQRKLLLNVVANWVGLADEQTTDDALAAVEATLDDTYVSWSGATEYDMTEGEGIYFLVSGPKVYFEFQPAGVGRG